MAMLPCDQKCESTRPDDCDATLCGLGGHDSGNVLDHVVHMSATHFTPTDETSIPTGECSGTPARLHRLRLRTFVGTGAVAAVAAGPFDFTVPRTIGLRIGEMNAGSGGGYDHNMCIPRTHLQPDEIAHVATVVHPPSGRRAC